MAFLNSYLNFNGNCEAAFSHYKSVFGGEFAMFTRFGDMPPAAGELPEAEAQKILHVSLPIGTAGCVLMGSDCPPSFPNGIQGNLFNISVSTGSKEEADHIFNGLAAGGTVTMALADTFWGAYFGMCIDAFGVSWMVNYDYPKG